MFTTEHAAKLAKHEEALYGNNERTGLFARVKSVEKDVRAIMLLRRWMIAGIFGLAADIILRLIFRS